MMNTKQMREEFEIAFSKKTASLPLPPGTNDEFKGLGGFEAILRESMVDDRIGDTYGENVFASAWWAWRESRAVVVIEFPLQTPYVEYYDDVEGGCFDYPKYLADVKAGIVAQGLQCGVKS